MGKYHGLPDDELLLHLQKGNEAAFTEIYDRYGEMLFAMAYNRVKDVAAAQDMVQDLFFSLWLNRNKSQLRSLKNYLATAVKYLSLAYLRKSERLAPIREEEPDGTITQKVENDLHYKHLLQLLDEEVNLLPEKCRLIFKCSREQNMTTAEIAREFNISPRTVETQISKALRQLRKRFKNNIAHLLSLLC